MDLLGDERDQWEALKSWLRQNGMALVGGLVLGTVVLLGWRWWQDRQQTQHQASTAAYETLLRAFDSPDKDAPGKAFDTFIKAQADSAYGPAARLAYARLLVERDELDKAVEQLSVVSTKAPDEQLRVVARLRLARVQLAQGKHDVALATLGTAPEGPFKSAFTEVRGDILLAKGDVEGARSSYQAALAARGASEVAAGGQPGRQDLLTLKLDDLPATAPVAAPAPAPAAPEKVTP